MSGRLVIYTDLDGSLLDHDSYSRQPADALLQELEQNTIPVIPTTSKTRAELEPLRRELNNQHPFIIENGAAVLIPMGYFENQPEETVQKDSYWVKSFTQPHLFWLNLLKQNGKEFRDEYIHFSALSIEDIAELTGLKLDQAANAALREYGEPIHWQGSDKRRQKFIHKLEQAGGTLLQGGRFLHFSGDCNKGSALLWLQQQYRSHYGIPTTSLAIGDSNNDIAMLEAADIALTIRSPSHSPPTLKRQQHSYISEGVGPLGWDNGVRKILLTIHPTQGAQHG